MTYIIDGNYNGPNLFPLTSATLPGHINISSVTVPSSGTYKAGDALSFAVTFPNSVTVSGFPILLLIVGSSFKHAVYTSGSGTAQLVFSYTVRTGDYDSDGISLGTSIGLNGGSLSSSAGAINLVLQNVGALSGILVDGATPQISSVGSSGTIARDAIVSVTGSQFGSKTGSIYLQRSDGSISTPQSILSWSDSIISFQVIQGDLPYSTTLKLVVDSFEGFSGTYSNVTLTSSGSTSVLTVTTPTTGQNVAPAPANSLIEYYPDTLDGSHAVTFNTDGSFSSSDSKYGREIRYRYWDPTKEAWSGFVVATIQGKPRNDSKGGDSSQLTSTSDRLVRSNSVSVPKA